MAKKTPYRNKRNRSPSLTSSNGSESESSLTPQPKTKKPRISKDSNESKSSSKSVKKSSKPSKGEEEDVNEDKDDPAQNSYPPLPSSDDDEEEEMEISRKTNSKSKSRSSKSRPSEGNEQNALFSLMKDLDLEQREEFFQQFLTSSKFLVGDNSKSIGDKNGNGKGQEVDLGTNIKHIWEGVVENWEDESEKEEDEEEYEKEANKLADALAAPFERLKSQSNTSLQEVIYTINQALQTALDPFKGDTILQQLKIWRNQQVKLADDTEERWDHTAAFIADRKAKLEEIMAQIKKINENKGKLIEQSKKDFNEALNRQAAEIEGFKEELLKAKEKYRNKIIKATDKDRINKEVNMTMTKFLTQFNS